MGIGERQGSVPAVTRCPAPVPSRPAAPLPLAALPPPAALLLIALLFWAAAVGGAWAGAFNEPAGQGLVILRGVNDQGDRAYRRDGRLGTAVPYAKRDVSLYVEYGLTDWFEILLQPDFVSTSLGSAVGARYTGPGTSAAGVQVHVLDLGPAVLAVQGTFQLPATRKERNLALIGNTSRNTDGRALLGASFELGSWPSFVDAEAGYRCRDGGAPDEVHLDLSFGTRPRPDTLLLLQSFATVPTGPGTAFLPRSEFWNVEASVVYDLSARWSVQFGLFTTVQGRNALRERGVDAAVWYRF